MTWSLANWLFYSGILSTTHPSGGCLTLSFGETTGQLTPIKDPTSFHAENKIIFMVLKLERKVVGFFFFPKVLPIFPMRLRGCSQQSEVAGKTGGSGGGVAICGCGSHQRSRVMAPSGPEPGVDSYRAGSPLFGSLF